MTPDERSQHYARQFQSNLKGQLSELSFQVLDLRSQIETQMIEIHGLNAQISDLTKQLDEARSEAAGGPNEIGAPVPVAQAEAAS